MAERPKMMGREGKISRLLEEWGNKCAYCGNEFGWFYAREGKVLGRLRVTLDHIMPYSFTETDREENLVPVCQVCNSLKGSRIYTNFAKLIFDLEAKWFRKGFTIVDEEIVLRLLKKGSNRLQDLSKGE